MPGRHRIITTRSTSAPTRVALTATAAALAMQPFMAPTAQGAVAAAVKPKPTKSLPSKVDVMPTYQDQRSCDPAAKPGVQAYAQMVLSTYKQGHNGGIVRGCGIGATSEHKEGRAFDWMVSVNVPAEKAAGDALTSWLTGKDEHGVLGGNARRLGIMYVIWNRRIWSTYQMGSGWRAYTGPVPHTDHVHTSFTWDGAMKRTSWWDGTATTDEDKGTCRVYSGQPAPVYTSRHVASCTSHLASAPSSKYAIVWPGQNGSTVKVAQAKLGVSTDGVFGSGTRTRLMSWQRTTKVPVTGVLDKPTWAKLDPSGKAPTPPTTPPKPPAGLPQPTAADLVLARTTTLTAYKATALKSGSKGAAVSALQKALGQKVDGVYGTQTVAAVKAFQSAKALKVTGAVDRATWDAVERAAYPLLAYRATPVQSGSKGTTVVALQKALKVTADGAFGPNTLAAVKLAQTKGKRPATGVVDVRTWLAVEQQAYPLGRVLVAPVAPKPPVVVKPPVKPPVVTPKPPVVTPKPPVKAPVKPAVPSASQVAARTSVSAYKGTVLRTGSRGTAVKALQHGLGMSVVDGVYGSQTAKTVKSFQKKKHLSVTGVVSRSTWNAVEKVAHPLFAYRTKVVRSGSTGSTVKALQKALKVTADGEFGPQTKAAVKKAQAKAKISQTGTVATLTWIAIEKQAYPLGKKRW